MLYRCGDEICIELSVESLEIIERLIRDCEWTMAIKTGLELEQFANELRAEVQHRAKPKSVDNMDLV